MNSLPPGSDYELNVATYEYISPVGAPALLEFCDTIGNPPFETLIVSTMGDLIVPAQLPGLISVPMLRGDCNRDGMVDVADTICALDFLFASGPSPCADAIDVNDDGRVDLADPISFISFQFRSALPPEAPFPDCGADPTIDDLGCEDSLACP